MALGNIYTFGLLFVPKIQILATSVEFWMIEPEMAFYDINDNMDLAEDFIKYLVRYALEHNMDDLQFLNDMFDKELIHRLQSVLNDSFVRITYTEAIDILLQAKQKFEFPVAWGVDLQSEHERYLVEKHFNKPVIITNYPKTIKAFYMKQNDDGNRQGYGRAFPKIGEIIGGSEREADLHKLESAIKEEIWMKHLYFIT